ncbi:MAG TPA: hypothetical protein VGL81_00285 [Polyangiaceae bacterium]|jgi:hypothetical protein
MSDPRDLPEDPLHPAVDAPATEEELAESAKLRDALEDPTSPNENAELARAMSSAWSPRDLSAEAHRSLVAKALVHHDTRRRRGRVVRVSFGAGAALAVAAAVLLLVRSDRQPPETVHATAVAVSRSTQALFQDRFAPTGGESARIDRIAMARAADLRDNEFAKWGVR